jgi:hypothetical protein
MLLRWHAVNSSAAPINSMMIYTALVFMLKSLCSIIFNQLLAYCRLRVKCRWLFEPDAVFLL